MFEFLSSANKHTVETQIDYFERAIRDSKSSDAYYPESGSPLSEPVSPNALRRPSDEWIAKSKEWIALQRKDYSDSKEILALCDRWEKLFEEYRKKMETERAKIQSDAAAAQKGMRQEASGVSSKPAGPDFVKPGSEKPAKASADAAEKLPDVLEFNRKHLALFESRIERVKAALKAFEAPNGSGEAKNAPEMRELSALLNAVVSHPDWVNVTALQAKIAAVLPEAKFTVSRNEGRPDGLFGELTMGHLEAAVKISPAAEGTNPSAVPDSSGSAPSVPRNPPTQPASKPQESPESISRRGLYVRLVISAIRDEIREGKRFASIRWNNSENKAKAVAELDSIVKSGSTVGAFQLAADVLKKYGVGTPEDVRDLEKLARNGESDELAIVTAFLRRNNATEQMHELFRYRNNDSIAAAIKNFSESQRAEVDKRVNRVMAKIAKELRKIWEREFAANAAAFKSMGIANSSDYIQILNSQYSESLRARFEMALAVKNMDASAFQKTDSRLWEEYRSAVDPKDEWFTISDESATGMANFLAYDLTSMLLAWGVAALAGRTVVAVGRTAVWTARATEITVSAGRANSLARGAGLTGRSVVEGSAFTASFAAVRNQEWFLNQPDWEKQVILNSLMFWAYRFASARTIPGNYFSTHPVVEGLVKQGLVVPAVITGAQLGIFDYDRIITKDPSLWNEMWTSYLLYAAHWGALALRFSPSWRTAVEGGNIKLPDGKLVEFRTADGGRYEILLPANGGQLQWKPFSPTKDLLRQMEASRTPAATPQAASPSSTPAPTPTQAAAPTPTQAAAPAAAAESAAVRSVLDSAPPAARQSAAGAAAEANALWTKTILDHKFSKTAWDFATKELSLWGISTVWRFPANLARLPAINARKVLEIWFVRSEWKIALDTSQTVGKRIKDSGKVLLTSSKDPFSQWKMASLANAWTMGVVAYFAFQEIQSANPTAPAALVANFTMAYLKHMNITLPKEIWNEIVIPAARWTVTAEI